MGLPPLPELSHLGHFLVNLMLILLAAKLFGELASRFGQSSVLGELLAGTIIGPFALGWVHIDETTALLAELGVIMLLFETGMETNLKQLLKVGWQSLAVAATGVTLPFAAGWGIGTWLGLDLLTSLLIGATLTATSIGITARTLTDLNELDSAEGRIIIGAAVLDDVVGLMILAIMQVLLESGVFNISILGETVLKTLVFMGMAFVVGRFFAQPFMRWVDRFKSAGALTGMTLAFILAICLGAELTGLSSVIGAFVAGIILNHTPQEATIHRRLEPVANFVAPIFFVWIGSQLDVSLINPLDPSTHQTLLMGLGVTVVAILGKVLAGWATWSKGIRKLFIGIGMVPRGEVGLIFTGLGKQLGVLTPELFTVLIVAVFLTTFMTPPALSLLAKKSPSQPEVVPSLV